MSTNLNLKKPIAFFDLEATGVNIAKDRIVEIAILKVHPNQNQDSKLIRINPGIPIPEQASEIHGIYDDDIADCPTFKHVAHEIKDFFSGCDLAGFNSNNYDIPLLMEEFLRAEVDFSLKSRKFVDVKNIFHKMEKRTLEAAYQFYCNKALENAHSADADTQATYEVLLSQIDRYDELENDIEALHKFSYNENYVDFAGRMIKNDKGEIVFNFGKHKGKQVSQVLAKEPAYYHWIMDADFPLYTKKVLTEIKLKQLELF